MTALAPVVVVATASWSSVAAPSARPAPALLAPNERRRASETVLIALQVAGDALAAAALGERKIASVFTSAYGDLGTTDALCRTLAADPALLSPTRFHHSVHNAASGYWAIGDHNPEASTALAAGDESFAVGLLEAATQCLADTQPVLLVGVDGAASGALASTNRSRAAFGVALVLAPAAVARADHPQLTLTLAHGPVDDERPPAPSPLRDNPMARALPLLAMLTTGRDGALRLRLTDHVHLAIDVRVTDDN